MEPRQTLEWDVLEHADFTSWLDGLRAQGWYRVAGVSGVKTSRGTIGYLFQYLEPAVQRGA
ncbi:MAG: hypothetical protein Q8M17_12945 [Actinomycetota bacterium]|nr:hypothetical protein [Actinomycetota bacterium]